MSETARTDGIIDDLVWCGRQLYHYEQPMMLPLSEESFRCYETALQMIERYRRALAAERERANRNQEDAERYRWLRDTDIAVVAWIEEDGPRWSIEGRDGHNITRDKLDAAIDAARRKA